MFPKVCRGEQEIVRTERMVPGRGLLTKDADPDDTHYENDHQP